MSNNNNDINQDEMHKDEIRDENTDVPQAGDFQEKHMNDQPMKEEDAGKPNEDQGNKSSQTEKSNPTESDNFQQMKNSMLNFLKNIQEWSNSNDPNSQQMFLEKIPMQIQNFLAANMVTYNLEHLKLIFIFFTNYIQIRINHIDGMSPNELTSIFKILEPAFPFYMNINNNNNLPVDFYDNLLHEVFVPFGVQQGTILNQSFSKLNQNVNIFFKYILTYLQYTNFFHNFIQYLNSPLITLDFDRFYFIYTNLLRVMQYYDSFDPNVATELMRAVVNYYEKFFENQQVKDINKALLDTFFKNNTFNDFSFLTLINEKAVESNSLLLELMKKDLKIIYFLLLSQNLERRVTGMKGLNDIINIIITYEKVDDKMINNNNNFRTLNTMVVAKKKILLEWLEKIGIFQILFGENIHEAILKKASFVLVFLYINEKLSFDQIDYIWKIAQDKHEAISASILNIFSDLISYFSIEQAMHILKIINEMPFKEVNDVTIKILDSFSNNKYLVSHNQNQSQNTQSNRMVSNGNGSEFPQNINNVSNSQTYQMIDINQSGPTNTNTNAGVTNELTCNLMNIKEEGNLEFLLTQLNNDSKDINDFKSFYLKILWKFSSENSFYSGLASQIIIKARKVFANILVKPVFKQDLTKYVKKCILGIGYNHLLTTNLTLLDMLIKNIKQTSSDNQAEILRAFGNDIKDIRTFLDFLEKQYSLTSTVLHAIIKVKKEVMVIAGEIIQLQTNMLTSSDKEKVSSINDIMTNFEIKFSEQNDVFPNVKCLEESKEKELSNLGESNTSRQDEYVFNNRTGNSDNHSNVNNINNFNLIEENDPTEITGVNNNNQGVNNNLDETLSTEKSLDNSISTISTDISSIEKSRIYMVREFIENNLNYYQPPNNSNVIGLNLQSIPLFQENYDIIFKKLKLNFSNANYYSIVNSLLDFLKYLIFSSDIQITQNQIEYLFTLLVENAVDEEEMNLFYFFFAEMFRYQHLTKQIYISEDNFNFILFDILLKIDIMSLPYSAFNLFKQIFFYINAIYGNLNIIAQKIMDVKDFSQLIGFETLWKFYIESKNLNISNDSQAMLVNLIGVMAKKEDNRDSFVFIFEKIFENLQYYFNCMKDNKNLVSEIKSDFDYEESTNKLINLLFIVNSTRQKLDRPREAENLQLNIQNYFLGDGKKTILTLPSDTSIKELKQAIITKVLFPGSDESNASGYKPLVDETQMMLFSKGKILKNDKLALRDYKLENGSFVQVHKLEFSEAEMEVSEERLAELITTVKFVFESLEDEVIKKALSKNSYNADDTVVYLFDDNNVANIRSEIQEDNALPIHDMQSKFNLELFSENKINLLINLLDLELISLNKNIWQLISAIKIPASMISMLTEPDQINFRNIIDVNRPNQVLLYLRVINCLVFNDKYFMNLPKLDEVKRNEWKMNLLITDGLGQLLEAVRQVTDIVQKMNPGSNYCKMNSYIQILQIISKWLHFFTFSTAISLSPNKETLSSTIKQIIHKRPQGVHFGIPASASVTTGNATPIASSQATPTFGSPHSSFSGGDEKNKKTSKSFSIIGAEEYDHSYEEEVSNSYYIKLITCNFHISIIKFLKFASSSDAIIYFNNDNEEVSLNLLEVLMILNEINPEAFKDVISIEYENSIIINFLFVEKSKFVRKVIENLFNILLTQYKSLDVNTLNIPSLKMKSGIKSIKDILMMHILNNYKRIYSGQVYEEFFNLFGSMLIQKNEGGDDIFGEDFNVTNLTMHILGIIYNLSLKTDAELTEIEQEQLSGNMHLFQCLCASNDQVILNCLENFSNESNVNIVNFLYSNLFSIDDKMEDVRFKYSNKNLRQKAYTLLLSLMRLKEGYKRDLGTNLISHHTSFSNDVVNRMDLEIGIRSKSDKFIGLRNYGCTCYLNSLIQQLYMVPSFRKGIFSVPILENPEKFTDLDKNPLYQLQLVFANLKYSIKQFHTPLHFIKSFDAFNNQPIDVSVQQDCEEFLNILIDKLEHIAKEVNMEQIFDDSIRGKISYETISIEKDYPYYSEKESSCLAISLDIKGKRNIEDALDLYVKGEVLEGENKYECEKYGKKISIIRRCSIKKLPKNVIIHLKRFEFDYNTFERVKLNDYCEFPSVIDFKPWTRGTIIQQNKDDPSFKEIVIDEEEMAQLNDPDAFKYKLTGVLVHSGATAEAGHYFSYIYDIETDKWHRYDDNKKVSDLNVNDLKAECFGEDKDNFDIFSRSQNAYLLFYTKIDSKTPTVDNVPSNIQKRIKEENMLFLKYKNYLDNDYFLFLREFLDYSVLKVKTIDKISKKEKSMSKRDLMNEEIYNTTMEMVNKQGLNLTEPSHFQQIKAIYTDTKASVENKYKQSKSLGQQATDSANVNLKKKIIKMGIYYYFEIIVQQRDKHKTNSYANFIISLIETDRGTAAWFLKTFIANKQLFMDYILGNNLSEVREGISRIVNNCIIALYNDEKKYLKETFKVMNLCSTDSEEFLNQSEEYRSCLMRFFKNNILDLFDYTRVYWSKFHQFQQIIFECFNTNMFEIVEMSLKEDLYTKIIYFIMNNQKRFETNFTTMGSKALEPNFGILIDILSLLVVSCVTEGVYKLKKYSIYSVFQSQENMLPLPNNWQMILDRDVICQNILRKYHSDFTNKMVHHLCWGDLEISNKLINDSVVTLKEHLRDIFSITNLIKNAHGFLEIDDNFKTERIKALFCLDDASEAENDSIFNYLMSFRDDNPLSVLICLKLIADLLKKHELALNYVSNYPSKLVWIFYLLKDFTNNPDKTDILQVEAKSENYNFFDLVGYIDNFYLVNMKINTLVANNNTDINFNKDDLKDSDMLLDFNKELQEENNKRMYDNFPGSGFHPPGP